MVTAPRLDEQLCFALYASSRAITNAYRAGLADLGLTYPQFVTLLALWENDDLTVKELGERLHLDSGTLSPLLKRLETLGYLTRHRATDDERRVRVLLTPSGTALQGPVLEVQRAVASQLTLTPEESDLLRTLARRLTGDGPVTA
ncbi:MarR family winged helix-turn-helix transcriptional regulator [Tessaracoccus antarcticus]|uniref:MarR family transcriptional regulator n=1 Tax=Tessaracoccus antarcticus TaxID=2479848 RepID=A0A3M0G5P1_9ACTN|nr:MarR family transcriptional regulator [Tessaracoccus antarcticus]RMB60164.1 MarR family transcriptional regulator [Tessaracoccus antarcticus]